MFTPGNILYGLFQFKDKSKDKYVIVLHKDENHCILTTFTTSQPRTGVQCPKHGKNKDAKSGKVMSHLFKQGVSIGMQPCGKLEFSFPMDTTIVPDYGFEEWKEATLVENATNLKLVCRMYQEEYLDLIYTLYQAHKTRKQHRELFERILSSIE